MQVRRRRLFAMEPGEQADDPHRISSRGASPMLAGRKKCAFSPLHTAQLLLIALLGVRFECLHLAPLGALPGQAAVQSPQHMGVAPTRHHGNSSLWLLEQLDEVERALTRRRAAQGEIFGVVRATGGPILPGSVPRSMNAASALSSRLGVDHSLALGGASLQVVQSFLHVRRLLEWRLRSCES